MRASDPDAKAVLVVLAGESRADQIRSEVGGLHRHGVFHDGEVMARQEQARGRVRGDKITWVTGSEPNCSSIGQLVSVVDSLVAKCNNHQDAGKLASYNIKWRTRVSDAAASAPSTGRLAVVVAFTHVSVMSFILLFFLICISPHHHLSLSTFF